MISYVKKFNEPEKCKQATDSLDCFKTVSLALGSSICNLTSNESDRMDCGKHYIINAVHQNSDISSSDIKYSPDFLHSNFKVNQIACNFEKLNLKGISKTDLLSWKTDNNLTACSRSDTFASSMDYCIGALGV